MYVCISKIIKLLSLEAVGTTATNSQTQESALCDGAFRMHKRHSISSSPAVSKRYTVSKEDVWIDGLGIPCWAGTEELIPRKLGHPLDGQDELTASVALLRACAKKKDLCTGIRVHDRIRRRGLLDKCSHALVTMYAKCGELAQAKKLFDMHRSKDVFTWNAMIAGYAQKGQGQDALNVFERMQCEGVPPNAVTFTCILKACGTIGASDKGEQIKNEIAKRGLLANNIALGNALVNMYAKCGALTKARQVLEELPARDVVSWNTIIAGYIQHSEGEKALHCLEEMQHEGVTPDVVTFISLLKACSLIGARDKGEKFHDEVAKQGLLANNMSVGNALVDMYAKCGALQKAQQVLKELPVRHVITWNALITGYNQHGKGEQALICFDQMQCEGLAPNEVTFLCALKACGSIGAVDKGEKVHDEIAKQGMLRNNIKLGTALVDMYTKCGAFAKARQVLRELSTWNVSLWNALIAGYVQHGEAKHAMNCFEQMQEVGVCPDVVTFICILKACGSIRAVDQGEKVHDEIAKEGLLGNEELGNALVDMYAKCGALAKAQRVLEELPLRNVVSWSALIAGYALQGDDKLALNCFEQMQHEGIYPNAVTFISILKACGNIGAIEKGEQIYNKIFKLGLLENDVVLSTAVVDMYAKCGALGKARQVLDDLPVRSVSSWNALIAVYVEHNDAEETLNCFEQMQREGLSPNRVTFICILKACGSLRAADKGENFHDEIVKNGMMEHDIELGTALVDMYAKCGALTKARRVLDELSVRDAIAWNTLLAGYIDHGEGERALTGFEDMKLEGICANAVTYLYILKASGSIKAAHKGEEIHEEISKQGLLENNIALGTALVDMYAKCGTLSKARQVLGKLPLRDVISWNALIAGSVQQGEAEQALKWVEQMLSEGLFPNAATFSCVLSACSRLCLINDAQKYFVNMSTKYGLKPDLEQYTCMLDLFGRVGHLDWAVEVIEKMPASDCGVWSSLLSACQKWGDVNVGQWAFERALQVDKSDAAVYIFMASIYAAAGMQQDAENIEALRRRNKAWKKPSSGQWIDVWGNV